MYYLQAKWKTLWIRISLRSQLILLYTVFKQESKKVQQSKDLNLLYAPNSFLEGYTVILLGLAFPSHLGKYFIKIGKIKAIFGLGMTHI